MDPQEKRKVLQELGDIPESTYDELTSFFVKQLVERLPQLKSELAERDFEALAKTAHSLKGSSGNLRIHNVYKLTAEINDLAKKSGPEADIKERIELLEKEVPGLEKEFGKSQ